MTVVYASPPPVRILNLPSQRCQENFLKISKLPQRANAMPKVFLTENPIDSLALNPPARSADVYGSQSKFAWVATWYVFSIRLPPIRLQGRVLEKSATNDQLTLIWANPIGGKRFSPEQLMTAEFG
jgi:hypothetical protein